MKNNYNLLRNIIWLIILIQSVSSYAQSVDVSSGLQLFYHKGIEFNGGVNKAIDYSGNNYHGTLVNGVSGSLDRLGGFNSSLLFNGGTSYVQIPSAPALNSITNSITISFWIYLTGDAPNTPLIVSGGNVNQAYTLFLDGHVIHFRPIIVGKPFSYGEVAASLVEFNKWYHVVAVWNANPNQTASQLYVNGDEVAWAYAPGTLKTDINPIIIGGRSDIAASLPGKIDELRIYSRALNEDEIWSLYTGLRFVNQSVYPCGSGDATVNIEKNSGLGSGNSGFRWYDVPAGGPLLAPQTVATSFTYSISSPKTFYVSLRYTNGYESERISVTAVLGNTPDDLSNELFYYSSICTGQASDITLTYPEAGVSYQLKQNALNIGPPLSGTSTLTFPIGPLNTTTTFKIEATDPLTNCKTTFAEDITVVVNQYYHSNSDVAELPYTQDFENWIDNCAPLQRPDNFWVNPIAYGNYSWRRDDQGANANWNSPDIGNNPSPPTGHWARLHSALHVPTDISYLDLNIALPGTQNVQLTYDVINASNGVLEVLVSTDNGINFSPLQEVHNVPVWTNQVLEFDHHSNSAIIRFKYKAGTIVSDLGIDNVRIDKVPECPVAKIEHSANNTNITSLEFNEPKIEWTSDAPLFDFYFGNTQATLSPLSIDQPFKSYTLGTEAGLELNTEYFYKVVAKSNIGASACKVESFRTSSKYCFPQFQNGNPGTAGYISEVSISSYINQTNEPLQAATHRPSFFVYENTGISVKQGATYSVQVKAKGLAPSDRWLGAWIDFNRDSVFQTEGEQIYGQIHNVTDINATFSFNVPENANLGKTKLRIRFIFSGNNYDACSFNDLGETEDYDIEIIPLYCSSKGNSASIGWVDKFSFGAINRISGNDNGYINTNLSTTVLKGSSYTLQFSKGVPYFVIPAAHWKAWIDFNHDGDFTDAGEQVMSQSSTSNGILSSLVTIPVTATEGNTRMRVSMKYNSAPTSCETFASGEVEDYTLIISAAPGSVAEAGRLKSESSQESRTSNEDPLSLYPNPTDGFLYIHGANNSDEITITDNSGGVKWTGFYSEAESINVRALSSGMYHVKVRRQNRTILQEKFVKK